jgi:ribosomal-protein-serine acetyltransferase
VENAAEVLPERVVGENGLILRRWVVDDAEALAQAVAEAAEHLRPWMSWMAEEPQTLEQRRALLSGWERDWSKNGDVALGIFVAGRIAGSCGLHRRRGPNVLELGYWVHPAFTRQGLATAVARLLTDTAFTVPGVTAVEIHHDKANTASAAIPRRLGFRFLRETPDDSTAPAEIGIDCAWRMERDDWRDDRPAG